MSYMTSAQTTDLGEFMGQLQVTFDTWEPSGLDFEVEIMVTKWQKPLGKIIKNQDGICFIPDAGFSTYKVPTEPVEE